MRHVEFLGVPGSGKSTLARALTSPRSAGPLWPLDEAARRALRYHGRDWWTRLLVGRLRNADGRLWKVSYVRTPDRADAMVRFASRWPEYLETVLSVQRGRVDRDVEQDVVLKWILDLGAKFYLATQTLGLSETLVIDEGFAQRSVAVFAHGWRSDEISELGRYLLSMPVPDLVLFVDAPLEVCRERLDRSGWPARAAAMGAGERRAYLQAASDVVHAAVGELESVGVPVERIDGAAPVDSTRVQAKRSLSI